jgi:hypothetical protein
MQALTEVFMKMSRLVIQVSQPIKTKLDALRAEGTTASGLIRRLLNEFFGSKPTKTERRAGK